MAVNYGAKIRQFTDLAANDFWLHLCGVSYAHKAYDTVPHTQLLDRLAAKGVTGKAWRVIDKMYAHASSRTNVGGALSEPFPIEQGVAQVCPLSSFLHNAFVNTLLEDVLAPCSDDGIQVGERSLVGQSYADDIMSLAGTGAGLQRIIDVVRRHSQRWGWIGVSSAATSIASRYVAAYIVYVGAMLARETVDPSRLEAQ